MSRLAVMIVSVLIASIVSAESARAADRLPAGAIQFLPTDWPCWRGPQGNGVASLAQAAPLRWSASENVLWKAAIGGRGHSSPTVFGDQVFIATADEERDSQ